MPSSLLWPLIARRVRCGETQPPCFCDTITNAATNAVPSNPKLPQECRVAPIGFPRRPPTNSQRGGATPTTFATSGEWRPLAIMGYAEIANELDRDMPMLSAVANSIESYGEHGALHWERVPRYHTGGGRTMGFGGLQLIHRVGRYLRAISRVLDCG